MKYTLIDAEYDGESGISTARIACRYGEFEGMAYLHTDDRPYESSLQGPSIAESRAYIAALKYKIKLLRAQRKALTTLSDDLWNTPRANSKSYEWRRIRQEVERKDREIKETEEQIDSINKAISLGVSARIQFLDKKRAKAQAN